MPHKLRKIRKKRGSRTVGYGTIGQHRAGGQRGGHGKAGRHKHLWSYVLRHEPDYFEKKGFHPPSQPAARTVNVGELDEDVSRLLAEGKASEEAGGIHIDLKALGYDKLLGSGRVTHPFIVSVDSYSKSAVRKISQAEGKILQVEEEERAPQPPATSAQAAVSAPAAVEGVALTTIKGIGPKRAETLRRIGIRSVDDLAKWEPKALAEKAEVSEKRTSTWIQNARQLRPTS
jgi:large subunit ribosomal protein L15